ncbi:GCN5 family acetyltransferase (plasmid) [Pseudonocardia sp. EC080610-09]|uniref:GNAT family N-acetyltransferase n=1 Tax=unclassified Pseudonocardia TaxID=2619320 RepID=UPI000706415D|nr:MULTISPECIES: GNAT family N-acetyltransferase [unclassified Pseudonocardia]ALL79818.1 GCN5 family acetyltransferase [Pseudonocardia sp. EC080610-09]ALL85804.1 GCN5 family acetyltransferase [Pseudonocardia sp. EC080619-01]
MAFPLVTDRLSIRPWTSSDADAALLTYGVAEVTGWLTPETERITDAAAMRSVLAAWAEAQVNATPPRGRWAIEHHALDSVVGGLAIRVLPPYYEDDLEVAFQLRPDMWGHGYATEATSALIDWAFTHDDVDELFAVVRPDNSPAIATAHRLGMHWVGETDKYYDRTLQVYRVRPGDLAVDPMVVLPDET